jgi:CSLREA domain-containing protein
MSVDNPIPVNQKWSLPALAGRLFRVLLPAVILLLATPALSYAATIVVTTTADDTNHGNGCSLREALINATNNAATHADCAPGSGADTIQFRATTFSGGDASLIVLNSGLPEITSEILIDGSNATAVKVDGNGSVRPFFVALDGVFTLRNITVQNGLGENGGGIYNNGGVLSVELCNFINNRAVTNFAGDGGGIYTNSGNVSVVQTTFQGNYAGRYGGGLYAIFTMPDRGDRQTVIDQSAFVNNRGVSGGGGLYNGLTGYSTASSITIVRRSTFSGNTASTGGGLENSSGDTVIESSTFTANTAQQGKGSGVASQAARFARTTVVNSIIAGNIRSDVDHVDGDTVSVSFTSHGYNLIGTSETDTNLKLATNSFNQVGDQVGITNPQLGPLTQNGASSGPPTPIHEPLPSSPAVNAIPTAQCLFAADQRGVARPQGVACDIGAAELIIALSTAINTPADGALYVPGSSIQFQGSASHTIEGDLSAGLQWVSDVDGPLGSGASVVAILSPGAHRVTATAASSDGATGAATITVGICSAFSTSTSADVRNEAELNTVIACANVPKSGAYTINLLADLVLTAPVIPFNNPQGAQIILQGNGFSVDGGGRGPVLTVERNTTVVIHQLTIKNGQAGSGAGMINGGALTLEDSTINGNTATGTAGGGIANSGILRLVRSTVNGNRAPAAAGIVNLSGATLTLENSTISGNTATAGGAGALWLFSNSQATLRHSTLNDNSGLIFGGVFNEGTLTLYGSIIANHSNSDCTVFGSGAVTDQGFNLVEDGGCLSAATSQSGDPQLGPLADNGGATLTHAPLPSSPAVNLIPAAQCTVTVDQRGVTRPQVNACDSGAVEVAAADDDHDGVDNTIESGAPNNGDGNNDGILDSQQANVASLPNVVDGAYLTLAAPDGIALSAVEATAVPLLPTMPDATFPIGLVGFAIQGLTPGAAVDVTLYLPTNVTVNSYYKYGRTPLNPEARLYGFRSPSAPGAEILSDRIILHLIDGQRGDDDLSANGTIVDPGGPALAANTPPTVNANSATVTVNESENATNSGTVSDAEGNVITLNASVGAVVNHNDGAWSWSYAATDGPANNQTVTITADDGNGGAAQTSFVLAVNNVAPTISALINSGPLVNSGSATINISASDPAGANDPLSYAFDCHNDGTFEIGPQAESSATCSFATVGQFPVNVQVRDDDGGVSTGSTTVAVQYAWNGFFQPVDNLPTVNTVNAGSAIPVKFSLGGDLGLNIFASGYPASQKVSCGSGGSGSDPIEETVTTGGSSLQYDPGTQTYTYVWKTDKAWAGTCRQLIVRLNDGVDHIALFQFNGKGRSTSEGENAESEASIVQQLFLPLVNR